MSAPPRLGIDVGGPLSRTGDGPNKPDGADIHRAVTEGAWPFVVLFGMHYGYENIFVISRVNTPQSGHRHDSDNNIVIILCRW